MDKGKSVKINTTSDPSAGDVLDSTLNGMEEWDMNVMNDTTGKHPDINGKSSSKGK